MVIEGIHDGVEVDDWPSWRLDLPIQEVCDDGVVLPGKVLIQELQVCLELRI